MKNKNERPGKIAIPDLSRGQGVLGMPTLLVYLFCEIKQIQRRSKG